MNWIEAICISSFRDPDELFLSRIKTMSTRIKASESEKVCIVAVPETASPIGDEEMSFEEAASVKKRQ